MGYIYKITNKVNNKCYIGQTKELKVEKRWKNHINDIKQERGCPALREAVKKYSWTNFKFEILIICFDEDRFRFETEYIKKYNSQVPNGYNITIGGEGGCFKGKNHTEETKKKISTYFKNFYKNKENRTILGEKVKESLKNINISERMENSEKWKKYLERRKLEGYNVSDETKEKIKEGVKKYYSKLTDEDRINKPVPGRKGTKIYQYSLDGEFLNSYSSISDASRQTGLHRESIKLSLQNKRKINKTFLWKYEKNKPT